METFCKSLVGKEKFHLFLAKIALNVAHEIYDWHIALYFVEL